MFFSPESGPTPKPPATAADLRSTISPARRHDPPRWGRAGPTGTCTPKGAPPEGETRGGTERPRRPWGASVVISPAGPGRQGGKPQRWAAGAGTGRDHDDDEGGAGVGPGGPGRTGPRNSEIPGKKSGKEKGGVFVVPKEPGTKIVSGRCAGPRGRGWKARSLRVDRQATQLLSMTQTGTISVSLSTCWARARLAPPGTGHGGVFQNWSLPRLARNTRVSPETLRGNYEIYQTTTLQSGACGNS